MAVNFGKVFSPLLNKVMGSYNLPVTFRLHPHIGLTIAFGSDKTCARWGRNPLVHGSSNKYYSYIYVKLFCMNRLFFILGFIALFKNAICQPPYPDYTFGDAGIVVTHLEDYNIHLNKLLLQSDGKILVSSRGDYLINQCYLLFRFTTEGLPDSSFGVNGIMLLGVKDILPALALQSDGKIIAAGCTSQDWPNTSDLRLMRFTAEGVIDSSFGTDGMVTTFVSSGNDRYYDVAVAADGKILVCGNAYTDGNKQNGLIARYNSNGILDSTFSDEGIYQSDFVAEGTYFTTLVIQPDGKMIIAGYSGDWNGDKVWTVLRMNIDGTLDSTFDEDGMVETNPTPYGERPVRVLLQPDGKIIVGGTSVYDPYPYIGFTILHLARYNTDGSLDSTFGADGIVSFEPPDSDESYITDVALFDDGKILVGGAVYSSDFIPASWRFTSSGEFDSSFGDSGMATISLANVGGDGIALTTSIGIQPDQKFLCTGYFHNATTNKDDMFLIRYSEIATALPELFSISNHINVYPNPVYDRARFTYALVNSSEVSLQLSDLSGNIIQTFFSGNKSAGEYTEDFSLEGIVPGIYLLKLKTEQEVFAAKVAKM